jgi:ribose transport system permease protein
VLPIVALAALIAYFGFRADSFWTIGNLTLMSGQAGILLLAALGATLVTIAGSVDLSVGSTALVAGAVIARFIGDVSANLVVVIALTIAIGIGVGLLNGVVFAYGRVPSFITTLGTLSLLSGLGLQILGGESISFTSNAVQNLATGQLVPGIQNAALVAAAAFVVIWFLARGTRFGLYVYAIGGNESVVRLAGVRVQRVKVLVMVLSGITAALSGMLVTAQLGGAGPTLGSTTLLDSISAIVIGGTALSGGAGGVERTVLGVAILTVLSDGLNLMGTADYTQIVVKGAVIIVAAIFTMASQPKLTIK